MPESSQNNNLLDAGIHQHDGVCVSPLWRGAALPHPCDRSISTSLYKTFLCLSKKWSTQGRSCAFIQLFTKYFPVLCHFVADCVRANRLSWRFVGTI